MDQFVQSALNPLVTVANGSMAGVGGSRFLLGRGTVDEMEEEELQSRQQHGDAVCSVCGDRSAGKHYGKHHASCNIEEDRFFRCNGLLRL